MTLNAIRTPDNLGIKSKYYLIIRSLQSTVAKHLPAFPQLSAIDIFLDIALPEAERDEDYLQRLDALCSHLHQLSTGSYVIRHLHYNLSILSGRGSRRLSSQAADAGGHCFVTLKFMPLRWFSMQVAGA